MKSLIKISLIGSYALIAGLCFGQSPYASIGPGAVTTQSDGSKTLRDLPSIVDKGADPTGVVDSTSALQAAAAIGGKWQVPCVAPSSTKGLYKITGTITLSVPGTEFVGCGVNQTYILKYANVLPFQINCQNCGLEGMTILGTFASAYTTLTYDWPLTAPTGFTDTTGGVTIGVAGVTIPYEWFLTRIQVAHVGANGIDIEDGGNAHLAQCITAYNAHWGMFIQQSNNIGGSGFDPGTYSTYENIHSLFNGSGVGLSDGGNYNIGSGSSVFQYLKSYGAYGTGLSSIGFNNRFWIYSEKDGGDNIGCTGCLSSWVTSTAYPTGALIVNSHTIYQATNAATSGASAPTCQTGTCSDGNITWRFRSNYGIWQRAYAGGYNPDEINIMTLTDASGYGVEGSTATTAPVQGPKTIQLITSSQQYPGHVVADNFYATGSFLNAFTSTGGNTLGFAGYEASMLNGSNRRLWSGVHQPNGTPEMFLGSPDSIAIGFYNNATRKAKILTTGAFYVQNETAATGITGLYVVAGAGQSSNQLQHWQSSGGSDLAQVSAAGGFVGSGFQAWSSDLSSTQYVRAGSLGVNLPNNLGLTFSSTGQSYGTPDGGISRLAAGALGIGNGTQGTIGGTLQAGVIATDPGCTTTSHIGKQWFDITTTTTVYKVCLNVSGTLTWVTK